MAAVSAFHVLLRFDIVIFTMLKRLEMKIKNEAALYAGSTETAIAVATAANLKFWLCYYAEENCVHAASGVNSRAMRGLRVKAK